MRFRRLNVYGVRVLTPPHVECHPLRSLLSRRQKAAWLDLPRPGGPRSQWQIFYDLDSYIFSNVAHGFTLSLLARRRRHV